MRKRVLVLVLLLLVAVLIAIGRLIDLQVIRGPYFASLAQENRIRRIPIKASRGEILDRNGKPLARNVPAYKLATFGSGGVVTEIQEITREEALKIQTTDPEASNRILVDVGREYPLGEQAAHVVGYVNEVSPEEVGRESACRLEFAKFSFDPELRTEGQFPNSNFQMGDLAGRMGIEQQYDCVLRGTNGEELIEVDSRGRLVRKLGRREPVSGKNIMLSINSNLQEAAYKALLDAPNETGTRLAREDGLVVRGAVVAQDPDTGEILALTSTPSFDPGALSEKYQEYATDPNLPFFNRAVGGNYHPGSTFKIVVATAGLEESKISADYEFEDKGILTVGDFSYRNWYFTQYGRTEGIINIVRAITRSTDTFFYKAGELVGVDKLAEWSGKFGLGQKTGVDLPGEASGLVPTPEWKLKTKGERWFLGNTYHMAIGQGDITATPLQVNTMTSVIASGGQLCQPHLVKDRGSQNFQFPISNFQCSDIGLKNETVRLIAEGMVGACSPGGTAFPLFTFTPRVACKTGTAEFGDPQDRTHAWLTAFAPVSTSSAEIKPEITVTALVEAGGEGSRVAAPVVKRVLEEWFGR